jgi:hypothetical protein
LQPEKHAQPKTQPMKEEWLQPNQFERMHPIQFVIISILIQI